MGTPISSAAAEGLHGAHPPISECMFWVTQPVLQCFMQIWTSSTEPRTPSRSSSATLPPATAATQPTTRCATCGPSLHHSTACNSLCLSSRAQLSLSYNAASLPRRC